MMIDNVLVGRKYFVINFLNYELVYCYYISTYLHKSSSCILLEL